MNMNQNFTPSTTTTTCTDSGHNPPAIRIGLDARPFSHQCPTCGYSFTFAVSGGAPSR